MWIRTQNKKGLIEAICITCSGCDDRYRLYADAIGFEDYVLGTYPTEARALEVLDEIQENIETRKIADELMLRMIEIDYKNRKEAFKELACVYEMPKE